MFVEREEMSRYRGMRPEFVQRVWAKRRAAESDAARAKELEEMDRRASRLARQKLLAGAVRRSVEQQEQGRQDRLAEIADRHVKTSVDIIMVTAAQRGYTLDEVISPNRSRHLCSVRDACIRVVADAKPHLSLKQIGRLFRRDHTTIIHSLRKTRKPGQVR